MSLSAGNFLLNDVETIFVVAPEELVSKINTF